MKPCRTEKDCTRQPWCRIVGVCGKRVEAHNALPNQARRTDRARDHEGVTCPASRHVHIMADALARGKVYHMFTEEPQHCASALYSVLESLWKARAEIARLKLRHPKNNEPNNRSD